MTRLAIVVACGVVLGLVSPSRVLAQPVPPERSEVVAAREEPDITPGSGDYIYDDSGHTGGLGPNSSFVILGDMNADPIDGDSFDHPIDQLLSSPLINTSETPSSLGGPQQALLQGRNNTGQPF
jgi:hypothetical protein